LSPIQPDYYGGFDANNRYFKTASIPPSYHICVNVKLGERVGRLPGCVVMDDDPDQQCNQGRTGNENITGTCT